MPKDPMARVLIGVAIGVPVAVGLDWLVQIGAEHLALMLAIGVGVYIGQSTASPVNTDD